MRAIPTQRETAPRVPDAPGSVRVEATLSGSPLAPGSARALLRKALTEWAHLPLPGAEHLTGRLGDDATLVASELVTHAVLHADTEVRLTCELEEDTGALLVEVADRHPSRTPLDADPDAPPTHDTPEYGRGLRLVASLSESWGITHRPGTRIVWARLAGGEREVSEQAVAYAGECAPAHTLRVADQLAPDPLNAPDPQARLDALDSLVARSAPWCREAAPPARDGRRKGAYGDAWPARRPGQDGTWLGHGALSFLAEASDLLAGQLDEDLVVSLTGQLIVPRLADWCAVWLEDEATGHGGWGSGTRTCGPRLARVWHAGEDRVEVLSRALEENPPPTGAPCPPGPVPYPWPATALDGPAPGTPDVSPGAPGAASAPGAPGEEPDTPPGTCGGAETPSDGPGDPHAPRTGGTGGTALAYRLVAGGRPLGTLVIGRSGGDGFPDGITGLVEDLARRVALAVGAARQYARQATISAVLQRGLLPGAVAEIPGMRSALVHEPCDKGGPSGDFYDLFRAGEGRWCFAVGDVQGKGPEAAVVIGLVRPWLRLLAREGYRVAEVLDRLNQLLLDDATEAADAAARALVAAGARPAAPGDGPQSRFLSLLYGELIPFPGGAHCTLASAGHPLPLLLGPDGSVRTTAQPQTLLGVLDDVAYTSETFRMSSGDTLLCVTDGVTERRSGSRQFDDGDGLARALAGCAGMDAGRIAERITRLVHDFGVRPPADDLALLVLQAD